MQRITVTTVGIEVELRREGTEGVTREKVGLGLMEAVERPGVPGDPDRPEAPIHGRDRRAV